MSSNRRPLQFLLCVLCLQATGSVATAWAKLTSDVTVAAMSGQLSVQRLNRSALAPLRLGQPLFVGDLVKTGPRSKATILFADGAQARLNANTKIEITGRKLGRGGRQSLFRALSGQVWARLRPGNAVETRTAALGVLGTEIHLAVNDEGNTTLTVTDGRVDFYNDFGSVIVGEKQQSTARHGAAPSRPVTIQNAGLIVEWSFDLNRANIPREKFFQTPNRRAAAALLPRRAEALRQAPQVLAAQVLARRDYGDALFDAGQHEAARAQYESAQSAAGESSLPSGVRASLRVRLGYALLELGRLEEAEAAMRAALPEASATTRLVSATEPSQPERSAAPALVALADLKLERDDLPAAQSLARRAIAERASTSNGARPIALSPNVLGASDAELGRSEAHLTLGISLLRQGKADESLDPLRAVLGGEARALRYQARAWLSLALLARGETPAALDQARQAVRLEPGSGLARGNLAMVAFYSGEPREAQREAEAALELNPESVTARVALGQALLARGDVDEANKVAAQAVALDPDMPQARYLLGIADASRRDYRHAVRELRHAVELAPNDLLARSALARTYTAMGQQAQAVLVLRSAPEPQAHGSLAALGQAFYEQGRYEDSAARYRDAIRRNDGSALYQAELARTLIASNRIASAIEAARAAVTLAPNIGQYHSILGLAYQYGQMPAQAEREFREALLLDPNNALALAQLAYRHSASDLRPAAAGFAQGFLLDPAISRQLLRGGVSTEVAPSLGENGSRGLDLSRRDVGANGRLNSFGTLSRSSDGGDRPNNGRRRLDASEHLTFGPDSKTTLYLSGRAQRDAGGLAGSLSAPDTDDRSQFSYGQVQLAARRRLSASSHLWLGLFGNSSRNDLRNPQLNSFFDSLSGLPVPSQRFSSRALMPEVRYDLELGPESRSRSRLSLGAALSSTRFRSSRELLQGPGEIGNGQASERDRGLLLYSQLSGQVGSRLWLSGQLRLQRLSTNRSAGITLPGGLSFENSESSVRSYVLPNLLASYQLSRATSLRLLHSDRLADITSSTLAPSELLLTTERSALPFGIAERTRLSQIEVQRRTSTRSFLKAFAFRTTASNVQIGYSDLLGFGGGLPSAQAPGLQLDRWRGMGVGALYEQQVSRRLFLSTGATLRRTTARTQDLQTSYSGQAAPYEPKYLGHLNLNYIDGRGNKVGLGLRRVGSFYQDTPLALGRPRFGAGTYVDLLLAREPVAGVEFALSITNLFNRKQILFNDFSSGQRRVNFGVTRRF